MIMDHDDEGETAKKKKKKKKDKKTTSFMAVTNLLPNMCARSRHLYQRSSRLIFLYLQKV